LVFKQESNIQKNEYSHVQHTKNPFQQVNILMHLSDSKKFKCHLHQKKRSSQNQQKPIVAGPNPSEKKKDENEIDKNHVYVPIFYKHW
jgi:hypothetical protein